MELYSCKNVKPNPYNQRVFSPKKPVFALVLRVKNNGDYAQPVAKGAEPGVDEEFIRMPTHSDIHSSIDTAFTDINFK